MPNSKRCSAKSSHWPVKTNIIAPKTVLAAPFTSTSHLNPLLK